MGWFAEDSDGAPPVPPAGSQKPRERLSQALSRVGAGPVFWARAVGIGVSCQRKLARC